MVGFIKKKVSSYTLGEKLRRIREELAISLAEIAKTTKIKQSYLEKLESGNFDQLPPDVYVKGFLKGYALYLNIDPGEVIRQYEKERGVQDSIKKHQLPKNKFHAFRFPAITITPKMITVLVFAILVFGGFSYFYKEVGKFSQAPKLVVVQPISDMSVAGSSSVDIIGITDKDSKVTINEQPILVNDKGEFKETISLQQGINTIVVQSINRFNRENKKTYNISANYDVAVVDKNEEGKVMGAETETPNNSLSVEVRVEESPVWVSVEIDGGRVQSGTMLPGSSQVFQGMSQIAVTSGKANKTFIRLNGQDIGFLGEIPGLVRDVIFTKDTKIMPQSQGFAQDNAVQKDSNISDAQDKKSDAKKKDKKN